MEKISYEPPELLELDSLLTVSGDSKCADGKSEEIPAGCPSGADD